MPAIAASPTWTLPQVSQIYRLPLFDLIAQAHAVHVQHHPSGEVQLCHLLSVKTGGCPEDCAYCPQAARYHTEVEAAPLLAHDEVLAAAGRARAAGSTRFCMGAAWRHVKDGPEFDRVLDMVRDVAALGLEVCCTLGMLGPQQAERLAAAGLTAYNHNLDTSPEFYGHIISTRTYDDRLRTIENVRRAGISVCCGGILGLGESETDRIGLLHTLANLNPPPESVPINALVPVAGTPLAEQPAVEAFEFVRAIATARVLMPRSKVRLSAGRLALSREAQALCFYAGANSIFVGDKLLTTPNPDQDHDRALLDLLGLKAEPPSPAVPRLRPEAKLAQTGAPARQELEAAWQSGLDTARQLDRYRALPQPPPAAAADFCSNDYLGLSRHPAVRAALAQALGDGLDLGSTGSRLVSGNHPAFTALEADFAAWRGAEAALFYSSGYAAGVGLLTTVLRRQDIVFSDAHNHASLIDGMRLAGARRVIVPHLAASGAAGGAASGDVAGLREALRRHPAVSDQRRFLVVESLYSMDGDWAPLAALAEICAEANVALIVDEAHATGVTGPRGAGAAAALAHLPALQQTLVATLHPCGKALGAAGALVAGSRLLRDYLVNHSRSFIFSTAPSPLLAVQIRAAIGVIQDEPELARHLVDHAQELRAQLTAQGWRPGGAADSPIIPLVLGSDAAALAAESALTAAGFAVRAIRPPTVPEGTARLRLTAHAGHAGGAARRLAACLTHAPGLHPPAAPAARHALPAVHA